MVAGIPAQSLGKIKRLKEKKNMSLKGLPPLGLSIKMCGRHVI